MGRVRINGTLLLETLFTFGLFGLSVLITFLWGQISVAPISKSALDQTKFTSEKVVSGVPNTVIFHYDVQGIGAKKFFIQQNWDHRRRFEIDPTKKEATSTYYFPGYWRAKILADTTVLKEHDLIVESAGWLMTLDRDPYPRYFLPAEKGDGKELTVKDEIYEKAILGVQELPWLTAHYVNQFAGLEMDNLQLEVKVKNDHHSGLALCQNIQILVLGSEGIFSVPFSKRGCIGDLRLRFSDLVKDGKDNNLSSFGIDMDEWQKIRITVVDKKVQIFLNDGLIETCTYQESAGDFYGLRIKFKGLGKVDSVCVKNSQEFSPAEHLWPLPFQ